MPEETTEVRSPGDSELYLSAIIAEYHALRQEMIFFMNEYRRYVNFFITISTPIIAAFLAPGYVSLLFGNNEEAFMNIIIILFSILPVIISIYLIVLLYNWYMVSLLANTIVKKEDAINALFKGGYKLRPFIWESNVLSIEKQDYSSPINVIPLINSLILFVLYMYFIFVVFTNTNVLLVFKYVNFTMLILVIVTAIVTYRKITNL